MEAPEIVARLTQYVALVLALCVHEFSHAALARWLGDDTAEAQGRLTLSPIAHADPIGTVLLPLVALFSAMPLFGWARPVPVNPAKFKPGWYGRGQVLVAAGGPLSNLAQAFVWTLVYAMLTRILPAAGPGVGLASLAVAFVAYSVLINLILAAFNVLPVPPLDGSHVLSWSLPRELGRKYDAFVSSFGMMLLLLLILPVFGGRSVVGMILGPVVWVGRAALAWAGGS